MRFDELNDDNYLLFAIKFYNNPHALTKDDFEDDLKRIKYVRINAQEVLARRMADLRHLLIQEERQRRNLPPLENVIPIKHPASNN